MYVFSKNDIKLTFAHGINNSRAIIKTIDNNNYCSIDFYMVSIDGKGNFEDTWNHVIWSNCYNEKNELIQHIWNENILYLPFNYEIKQG